MPYTIEPCRFDGEHDTPEAVILCLHCRQVAGLRKEVEANGCANPACFPGMAQWQAALAAWQEERDDYIHARRGWQYQAAKEYFERDHPAPKTTAFKLDSYGPGSFVCDVPVS